MAQAGGQGPGNEEQDDSNLINLHILSPSTEISSPLVFSGLPTHTTVSSLKDRIRDVLPTKPAPERQRLIYRGRMLGNGDEILRNIFGQEDVSLQNDLLLTSQC
jgi:hypothetical protein